MTLALEALRSFSRSTAYKAPHLIRTKARIFSQSIPHICIESDFSTASSRIITPSDMLVLEGTSDEERWTTLVQKLENLSHEDRDKVLNRRFQQEQASGSGAGQGRSRSAIMTPQSGTGGSTPGMMTPMTGTGASTAAGVLTPDTATGASGANTPFSPYSEYGGVNSKYGALGNPSPDTTTRVPAGEAQVFSPSDFTLPIRPGPSAHSGPADQSVQHTIDKPDMSDDELFEILPWRIDCLFSNIDAIKELSKTFTSPGERFKSLIARMHEHKADPEKLREAVTHATETVNDARKLLDDLLESRETELNTVNKATLCYRANLLHDELLFYDYSATTLEELGGLNCMCPDMQTQSATGSNQLSLPMRPR